MYEGLRTNLPYVSDAKATWARDKRTSFGLLATACPVSVLGGGGASRRVRVPALMALRPGCDAVSRTRVSSQHGRVSG